MKPIAAAVLLAIPILAATSPARADPKMTEAQARKILAQDGTDAVAENLPQQILGGKVEVVEALLVLGVDVNAKTSLPQSPLELAAMGCAGGEVPSDRVVAMIKLLAGAGADPNTRGIGGLGPLMTASQQCGAAPVQALLDAGARKDTRTPQGFTPLSMALVTKHYEAAEVLIAAGARLSPEVAAKFEGGAPDPRLQALLAKATGP